MEKIVPCVVSVLDVVLVKSESTINKIRNLLTLKKIFNHKNHKFLQSIWTLDELISALNPDGTTFKTLSF